MMLSSNALSVIVAARRRQVAKWQSGSKSELQFVQQEQQQQQRATRRGWK